MVQAVNLHRFGNDEDTVGMLMAGALPEDPRVRLSLMKGPVWKIEQLLSEHNNAKRILDNHATLGSPFALLLRSFAAEQTSVREGTMVHTRIELGAMRTQEALAAVASRSSVPLVKFHGGSDGFAFDDIPNVLSVSTHGWEAVAEELISAAVLIIVVITHRTPGIVRELEMIAERQLADRCIILLDSPEESQGGGGNALMADIAQFPNVFDLGCERNLEAASERIEAQLERTAGRPCTPAPLSCAPAVPFSYLELEFRDSAAFGTLEQTLWRGLRWLRALVEPAYWGTLNEHQINYSNINFARAWKAAHVMYGYAVATEDFTAMLESLQQITRLENVCGSPNAGSMLELLHRHQLLRDSSEVSNTDGEFKYLERDEFELDPGFEPARERLQRARVAIESSYDAAASRYFSAAANSILAMIPETAEEKDLAATILREWATAQEGIGQRAWAQANRVLAAMLQ